MMSDTSALAGKLSSARSSGGSPTMPWLVALTSIAAPLSAASRSPQPSAAMGPPNSPASADHDDGAGIGAPPGLRFAHAFDIAEGIVVVPSERSIGCDDDAVHRADATCQRIDPVDDRERGLLVRDGQVAAGETERRQCPQGGTRMFGLDGERHIGAREAILAEPIIVQFR